MNYGWIVDKDHLSAPDGQYPDDTLDRKGVMGPRDIEPELQARLEAGEGAKWRCYDDDGELYYSGRLVRTEGEDFDLVPCEGGRTPYCVRCDGEEHEWFGPLWDFALPDAGAVIIRFEKDGKWGVL